MFKTMLLCYKNFYFCTININRVIDIIPDYFPRARGRMTKLNRSITIGMKSNSTPINALAILSKK
jgi:hypothetical protein